MNKESHQFNTYKRQPVTFVRGHGPNLWDDKGRRYLDFFSGIAVCGLGHADRDVARAVTKQVNILLHTSNLYYTRPQEDLARELSRRTFGGKVFFANSGAEANECAIKLARRHGCRTPDRGRPRYQIIVFRNSFHGRTLATLAATAQKHPKKDFGPLPGGFPAAEFGDLDSVRRKITPRTCAVLIEPIQGEGGVRTAPPAFFRGLRELCRKHHLLLMFDEIQTGMGRTGTLFAYQNKEVVGPGIVPDVLTVAKGLANGLPIGATLAQKKTAALFGPGDHGSTFGGGAVPCGAGLAVMKALNAGTLARVRRLGRLFREEFEKWQEEMSFIKEVRGAGCILGLELRIPGGDVVAFCRERGLLVNCTAERVIRLLPPFCLTDAEAAHGLRILKEGLRSLKNSSKRRAK
ncbi:MAG TPA: aspartate aminotransferase family protein [Elusimicrobiota bacterium]|nr:aspartate aminotransferase family protein [Elusimicrobiota bacterium]